MLTHKIKIIWSCSLDPNCPTWYKLNLNQPPFQQFIEMLTGTQPLNAATLTLFQ